MRPQKHTQTAAPLISMIIRTVYAHCGVDFETGKLIGEDKTSPTDMVKPICCYMTTDLVAGYTDRDIHKILHIGQTTYYKNISVVKTNMMISKSFADTVERIRVKILEKAATETKYSSFVRKTIWSRLRFNL